MNYSTTVLGVFYCRTTQRLYVILPRKQPGKKKKEKKEGDIFHRKDNQYSTPSILVGSVIFVWLSCSGRMCESRVGG